MLTVALNDTKPEERAKGIEAGFAWRRLAHKRVFYTDHGWSEGMKAALALYEQEHMPFLLRQIGAEPPVWAEAHARLRRDETRFRKHLSGLEHADLARQAADALEVHGFGPLACVVPNIVRDMFNEP